jgi:hypothetical protein
LYDDVGDEQLDYFYIFFYLLRFHCNDLQQFEELKRVNKLVSQWRLVTMYCCKSWWLNRLLQEIVPHYLHKIHSTHVSNSGSPADSLPAQVDSILGLSTSVGNVHSAVELSVLVEVLGSFTVNEIELKNFFRLFHFASLHKVRDEISL